MLPIQRFATDPEARVPLDPQAKAILDAMPPFPDFDAVELSVLRQAMDQGRLESGEPEPVGRAEDRTLPGPTGEIPVRIYRPEGRGPFPGLLYFHGGGFVFCNLDTHDGTCRALCNRAGCVVVSVDYRLAPEHPYPAAADDCFAATGWLAKHGAELDVDITRLAVAGDSAGGNLAAVVSQMGRDRGGPPLRFQLLVYPVIDCDFGTDSYRENAEGYFLTRESMRWFWGKYLGDSGRGGEPYASPIRAADLSGLPPGLCITAEYDPLRDEGEHYAARLREAGVACAASRYDGVIHGFVSMFEMLDKGSAALDEAAGALRAALA